MNMIIIIMLLFIIDAACGNSTYAFASLCNFEYNFYRPLNGYINICPQVCQLYTL